MNNTTPRQNHQEPSQSQGRTYQTSDSSRARDIHDWLQGTWLKVGQSSFWHFAMVSLLCLLVGFSALNPKSSWDVLGYVGSALQVAEVENIHGETYALVSQALGQEFIPLTLDNPQDRASTYRSTMSQNPEAFEQQLPYYLIRPLYVSVLAAGYQLGFNPVDIMLVLSVISGFLIGLLVYRRLLEVAGPLTSFLATTALMLAFRLPAFAGFLSPDPLVAGLFIAFVFQFEKGLSIFGVIGFVVALLLLRSNAVVFTTPLIAVGLLAHYLKSPMTQLNIPQALGVFGLSLVLMKCIEIWAGNYGWWTVFYFTFVESMNFPADFNTGFQFESYIKAVIGGGRWLFSDRYVTCFYLFMALMVCHFSIGGWYTRKANIMLFFSMLCVIFVGYFLLFPVVFLRFYFAIFMLSGVYAFVSLCEHTKSITIGTASSRYH